MDLPVNFEMPPNEDPHRAYRNMIIEFKKLIKTSKNLNELQQEMQKFIEESHQMDWHVKTTGVYRKPEGEKIAGKIFAEFKRYISDLSGDPQSLIDALDTMEQFVRNFKVT